MSVTNKPKIEAYVGASGSGKGVSIGRRLKELKPKRLLIWDPRDEYAKQAPRFTSLAALVRAWAAAGAGPIKARYVPGADMALDKAFAVVCNLAFEAKNLCFLAEELSDVTTAGHAPAAWRRVITQGRHQALHVMAAAQRPALIDKTLLGNCTYIRCFTLRFLADRIAMARALDVDESRIAALMTTSTEKATRIQYVERDFRDGILQNGIINLTH